MMGAARVFMARAAFVLGGPTNERYPARMHYALIALAIAAGMLIPAQAGFNTTFKDYAGHPLYGALVNFLVGLAVIALIAMGFVLTRNAPPPQLAELPKAPWWSWLGGLCGATMVLTSVLAVRPLGGAGLMACLVTGQLISSVIIDHNGWLNIPKTPASPMRIAGVVLLLAGLALVLGAPSRTERVEDLAPLND